MNKGYDEEMCAYNVEYTEIGNCKYQKDCHFQCLDLNENTKNPVENDTKGGRDDEDRV